MTDKESIMKAIESLLDHAVDNIQIKPEGVEQDVFISVNNARKMFVGKGRKKYVVMHQGGVDQEFVSLAYAQKTYASMSTPKAILDTNSGNYVESEGSEELDNAIKTWLEENIR